MTAILGVKTDNGVWLTADRSHGNRIKSTLAHPKIQHVGLFWFAHSGTLSRDVSLDVNPPPAASTLSELADWLGPPCKGFDARVLATQGSRLWVGAVQDGDTRWGWAEVAEHFAIGTGDEALLAGYLAALPALREANPNDPGVLPLAMRVGMAATAQVVAGVGGPCDQLYVRFERTASGIGRMRIAEFWTDGKPVDIS